MGVNCSVRLNEGADWKKVGQVGCVLLGAKVHKATLGLDGYHASVDGWDNRNGREDRVARKLLGQEEFTKFLPSNADMPEYIYLLLTGDSNNPVALRLAEGGEYPYHLWYGLEIRSLYPKATAAKIALARGITKFFGGNGVYNDARGTPMRFRSKLDFIGESNPAFYRYQDALLALKPLTQKDIDYCQKWASY